jgi:hypothetical protein
MGPAVRTIRRWPVTILVLLATAVAVLGAEEARFGDLLGRWRFACEAIGGKFGSAVGRCINRTCYMFEDCGDWAYPAVWRDRIEIGDPISKVIFWLGNPQSVDGEAYSWARGKGDTGSFSAVIRNGRLVALDRS